MKNNDMLAALDVRFALDGDDISVREYLHLLLSKVWEEQEGFNAKRPFGDSGWEYDLFMPLAQAGFIDAKRVVDAEDGSVDFDFDDQQIRLASAYVGDLISAAFFGVTK
jgi:hypothetical protein